MQVKAAYSVAPNRSTANSSAQMPTVSALMKHMVIHRGVPTYPRRNSPQGTDGSINVRFPEQIAIIHQLRRIEHGIYCADPRRGAFVAKECPKRGDVHKRNHHGIDREPLHPHPLRRKKRDTCASKQKRLIHRHQQHSQPHHRVGLCVHATHTCNDIRHANTYITCKQQPVHSPNGTPTLIVGNLHAHKHKRHNKQNHCR